MSVPIYEPLNTLKQVDENIWIVDGDVIEMNVLNFGVPFSTRMTIIKLDDGVLWCHSPIKPNDQLIKEINQLGEVKHLISPNKLHYAYIHEWKNIYPNSTTWASPGVEKRASSQNILVKFDKVLGECPLSEWSKDIDQLIFKGSHVIEEVVFFHKSSHVLILTDLIENFEASRTSSKFWKTIYKLGGIADPNGQTPIDMRLTFWGQKDKARRCYYKMLSWNPEKIILSHGRWYDSDGMAELKRAFNWLDKK